MFRSLVIGLGSMCAIALVVLVFQNSDGLRLGERIGNIGIPDIELPKISLFSPKEPETDPAIVELQDQISMLAAFLDDQDQQIRKDFQAKDEEQLTKISALNAKIIAAEKSLEVANRKNADLTTEIAALRDEVAAIKQDIQDGDDDAVAAGDFKALGYKVSSLERKIKKLSDELDTAAAENTASVSPTLFAALREEVKRLSDAIDHMETTAYSSDPMSLLGMRFQRVEAGLSVVAVAPHSPAAEIGIQAGDVITKAARTEIRSIHDLQTALEKARLERSKYVIVMVLRYGNTLGLALSGWELNKL